MYTLLCFRWVTKNVQLSTESSTQCYVAAQMRGGVWRMSMSESVSQSVSDSLVTPWTVAHQAPLSMGFSRQEYWSGLPLPSLEYLPNPGIEPGSPAFQADSLPFELQGRSKNYLLCDNSECVFGKQHKLVD